MAEAIDDICRQLSNNRIDTEELKLRLGQGIAEPLHKVAGQMFPELERRVERSKRRSPTANWGRTPPGGPGTDRSNSPGDAKARAE